MKKNILKIFATGLSIAFVASCDLNLSPNNAIAVVEGTPLVQTKTNLSALENGILSAYRSIQNGDFVLPQEFMVDEFNATIDFGNNYGGIHKTDQNFTSADYYVEDFWAYNYFAIKNFNVCIENLQVVPEDLVKDAAVVRGEAFFFRASSYLNLARQFGKIPVKGAPETDLCVPLVVKYSPNDRPARATVAAVYKQIGADLDSAAVYLAGVKGAVRSQKPTIDAVNALYARYYLDLGENAKAAEYAHKVIDGGTYALAATLEDLNKDFVNDAGTEAIMQLAISLTEFTGNSYANLLLAQKDDKVEGGECFRPYYIPTKAVIDSYEQSDLRFLSWFDNTTPVLLSGTYYTGKFYTFVKYRGNPDLTSSPIRNGRQAPKPLKISEMYLIAAEAELASSPAAAKADLNALQIARGASQTEATAENVQKEWFKETIGEGLRMSCLKRWGKGFENRTAQSGAINQVQQGQYFDGKSLKSDSYFFQWPIPSHELKVNHNLVQNTGYDAIN